VRAAPPPGMLLIQQLLAAFALSLIVKEIYIYIFNPRGH